MKEKLHFHISRVKARGPSPAKLVEKEANALLEAIYDYVGEIKGLLDAGLQIENDTNPHDFRALLVVDSKFKLSDFIANTRRDWVFSKPTVRKSTKWIFIIELPMQTGLNRERDPERPLILPNRP